LLSLLLLSCNHPELRKNSTYSEQLNNLRQKCYSVDLKSPKFFLFGMGNRSKYLYRNGQLKSIGNNSILYQWQNIIYDSIIPDQYKVIIKTKDSITEIYESCNGVYIKGIKRH